MANVTGGEENRERRHVYGYPGAKAYWTVSSRTNDDYPPYCVFDSEIRIHGRARYECRRRFITDRSDDLGF